MDIDVSALKALVREKELSYDVVVDTLEQALLLAYHRTEGAADKARVQLDRKTGHVTVWAREPAGEDGTPGREYEDTPDGFGRVAATTARQVILQRLREAEDDATFGEFVGTEGDLVSGIVQQGNDPRMVLVDLGRIEAVLPPQEQVPGEKYAHGTRLKCHVVSVAKTPRGPRVTVSRTHPDLVKSLFALEVPEIADGSVEIAAIAREAGHRTKIAVHSTVPGLNAKGACIGPMGQRVRGDHGRAARREDRHRRLVRGPGGDGRPRPVAGPGDLRHGRRRGRALRPGHRAGLPALARDRQGGPERPAGGPAHRLAHRHPVRHRPRRPGRRPVRRLRARGRRPPPRRPPPRPGPRA